jgi:hypothetical protein
MSMKQGDVSELRPPTGLLFIPHDVWIRRAVVEYYWQGKPEELGENPVPVPLCPPLTVPARIPASEVRGRWLKYLSHYTAKNNNSIWYYEQHYLVYKARCQESQPSLWYELP